MMEAENIFMFPGLMVNDTDALEQVLQGTRSALRNKQKEQPHNQN
jgi:hypothetical protein